MRAIITVSTLFFLISSYALFAQPSDPKLTPRPAEQVFQISNVTGEPIPPAPLSDAYEAAYRVHVNGKAGSGIEPLKAFIASNPEVTSKAEAQFWLGRAYSDFGKIASATEAFFESYKINPKGRYAPLALLNLGSMLYSMDQPAEACQVWDSLEATFITAEFSSVRLVGADRRTRFDCPNKATTAVIEDSTFTASEPSDFPVVNSANFEIDPKGSEVGGEATTFISADKCTVEIRVGTPENWLDDSRMKNLVIKHGMELFSQRGCMDWKGKPANEVKILVRQMVSIAAKKWDGPCPESISAERRWMCSAPMGYIAGSLTGDHLGNFKDTHGAGVMAEIKQQSGATHDFFFGGRSFERIADDVYLVSYDNKALKTKQVDDQFKASDRRRAEAIASKNAATATAETKRNANIATFKRQAALSLTAASRGYGAAAIDRMVGACFPTYAKDAVCKDFRIDHAQFRSPSRADVANGITAIVDIKASALSKIDLKSQWREICSSNTFIQVKTNLGSSVTGMVIANIFGARLGSVGKRRLSLD